MSNRRAAEGKQCGPELSDVAEMSSSQMTAVVWN